MEGIFRYPLTSADIRIVPAGTYNEFIDNFFMSIKKRIIRELELEDEDLDLFYDLDEYPSQIHISTGENYSLDRRVQEFCNKHNLGYEDLDKLCVIKLK